MAPLKTNTAPAVQCQNITSLYFRMGSMQKLHITQRYIFMKSWNVSIVLNLTIMLYDYESNETVQKKNYTDSYPNPLKKNTNLL